MRSSNTIIAALLVSLVLVGLLAGHGQAAGLRRAKRAGPTRIIDGNQEIELQPGDTLMRNADGSYVRQRQDTDPSAQVVTNGPPVTTPSTSSTPKPAKSGASSNRLLATGMLLPQLLAAVSLPLVASYWMRTK